MATDLAEQIERCGAAWGGSQWAALTGAAGTLGFKLDRATATRLDALLAHANGNRKSRLLTRLDLVTALCDAVDAEAGIVARHAGLANVSKMVTTVALVVRTQKKLTLGVTTTGALSGDPHRAPAWRAELSSDARTSKADRCRGWARRKKPDRVTLACGARKEPSAPVAGPAGGDALLASVLAAAAKEGPRRVYADWLLERSDPRGEFINLQCDLEELRTDDPKRATLEVRAAALLRANETKWSAPIRRLATSHGFRRGFIEAVTMKGRAFLHTGAALFAATPILDLTLENTPPALMKLIAASPLLGQLEALCLPNYSHDPILGDEGAAMLAASPHLKRLRSLSIALHAIQARGVASLESAGFERLQTLHLFGNNLAKAGGKVLAASRSLTSNLLELEVSNNGLGDEGLTALARAPSLSKLVAFKAWHERFGADTVTALLSGALVELRELSVYANRRLGDAGLRALAACPRASQLTRLGLGDVAATPKGILALAQSPHLRNLRELDLSSNDVGQRGAQYLLESPHLPSLRRLKCAAKGITRQTLAELTERRGREASTG